MFSRLESRRLRRKEAQEHRDKSKALASKTFRSKSGTTAKKGFQLDCVELIEKALLAPLALLRGTNLDIWSEWSGSLRWRESLRPNAHDLLS